jgi:hypothetical protein
MRTIHAFGSKRTLVDSIFFRVNNPFMDISPGHIADFLCKHAFREREEEEREPKIEMFKKSVHCLFLKFS